MTAPANVLSRSAAEACRATPLSVEARALLRGPMTVRQFAEALVESGEFMAAGQAIAYALPKRAAVWWACQCVRQVPAATTASEPRAALAAAEKWVSAQDEPSRRAAQAASEAATAETPAGCVALAAFLSGGSIAPPGVPDVLPAETLTPGTAAGAVALAAVLTEPEKAAERWKKFIALAADVDNGKSRWPG